MEPLGTPGETREALEQVMVSSYGRLVAYLSSVSVDIAAAEDALSEAMTAALRTWPLQGVPERPDSWLVTVARRSLIDAARRRRTAAAALPMIARQTDRVLELEVEDIDALPDKRLELLAACAHPAVDPTMHSPLMLQTVLGLDAARIAAAFLIAPATMGQRLVRVKTKIRAAGVPFTLPGREEMPQRVGSIMDAIYVAYATGWEDVGASDPASGDPLGLVPEAVRLGKVLCELVPEDPEAHGLLALMLHSSARAEARQGADGSFVPLDRQDLSLWSRDRMVEAEWHLGRALALGQLGPYQLQAAIQSVHNRRALTGVTDWAAVADLYDGLVALSPTVGGYVARAVARGHTDGPARALSLLDELPAARVAGYQPYWVARAHLLRDCGRWEDAAAASAVAVGLTASESVRRYLLEHSTAAR